MSGLGLYSAAVSQLRGHGPGREGGLEVEGFICVCVCVCVCVKSGREGVCGERSRRNISLRVCVCVCVCVCLHHGEGQCEEIPIHQCVSQEPIQGRA